VGVCEADERMKKVAADSLSLLLTYSLGSPITSGNQPACLSRLRSAGGDTNPPSPPPRGRGTAAAAGRSFRRSRLRGESARAPRRALPTLSRLGSAPAWWPSAREPQPAARDPPEPPCPRSAPRAPSCTDKSAPASSAGRSSDTILAKLTESKSKALSHESFLGIGRSFLPFRRRLPRLLLQRGGRQPRPWSQKATLFISESERGKAGDFCARAAGAGASASSRHFSLKKVC